MYQLIRAIVRSYDRKKGIEEQEVGNEKIRDVISQNAEVYLVLTNSILEGEHVLDLADVYVDIYQSNPDLTVNQWLDVMGNKTLPTRRGEVYIKRRHVKSMDAWEANYVLSSSTGSTLSDTNDILDIDKPHTSVRHEFYSMENSHRNLLASVNGLFHLTDSDHTALYVLDGAVSSRISGSTKVTLHNFGNLGDMRCIPFTHTTITPKIGTELYKGVTVTLPDSLKDKTVLLSIMGHLYYSYSNYRLLGESSIYIDWKKINPYRHYFNDRDRIDLTLINAAMNTPDGTDIVNKEVFMSNEVIRSILNLSQSFIIVIDNPNISFELERIEETGLPGKWLSYGDPYIPYTNSDGYFPPISTIKESRCYVISTSVKNATANTFFEDSMLPSDSNVSTDASYWYKKIKKNSMYKMYVESSTIETKLI